MADNTKRPAPEGRLDTIFLTGPGGQVYEFPRALAAQYLVTPDDTDEPGHLPIAPYGAHAQNGEDDPEVGGRHRTIQSTGASCYHREVRFGVYLWTDGYFYRGEHFHPYGDETGQPA
jgi:hypothetical protein